MTYQRYYDIFDGISSARRVWEQAEGWLPGATFWLSAVIMTIILIMIMIMIVVIMIMIIIIMTMMTRSLRC